MPDIKILVVEDEEVVAFDIETTSKGGDVNFQLDCDQQTVRFRVADSGIGIPKQDLSCYRYPTYR